MDLRLAPYWLARFEKLNGRDPPQQAMVLAMIYPDAEKGGRGKKSEARNLTETDKFSYTRLNEARSVVAAFPRFSG
jgi:hypothetical protein